MDKDTIGNIVRTALNEAEDFIESEISDKRIKAQRYFEGEVDIGQEEGRSKVVSTKVRDTIRAIKPSLMRVFLAAEKPVEFVPSGPEDVATAEQATQYAHYVFNKLNGYTLINDAFHDALVKKTGILKAYWDEYQESEIFEYSNLTEEEYMAIVNDDHVQVIEHSQEMTITADQFGMQVEVPVHELKISYVTDKGKLCIESVPPEEFLIDSNAKSIDDCYVCGQRTEMRVGDLVEMGFDFDEVSELSGGESSGTYTELEEYERKGYYDQDDSENANDPSMKLVTVTEAYMRMDIEGTGIPQRYKFILGGDNYKLLDYELWGEIPFAVFEVDPEPHTFFGRSIADLIMNDQDASTAMIRGILDNVALTNNPRTEFVEGQVNVDDLMNNEIGGLVRTRAPGMIRDMSVPFVAGQTLSAVEYTDRMIEQKTGVSRASMGLDPDSMQSTTRAAVNATVQAAAGQVEVIARNLAEGGMTRLFKLILKLFNENTDEAQMMRMNGQFVPVDPRSWNVGMDVTVNIGLGTGQEEQKLMALQQTLQQQLSIWQNYGHDNGLVSMTGIRNTLADMNVIAGIRNNDRYYNPMNQQIEAEFTKRKMQEQAQQPKPLEQTEAYLKAEQMKVQAKAQGDVQKAQIEMAKVQSKSQYDMQKMQIDVAEAQADKQLEAARLQLDIQEALASDDLERDKLDQQLLTDAARIIGQYGTQLEIAKVKEQQAKTRQSPIGE